MAMNYEFERHIKAAEEAGNEIGVHMLRGQQATFKDMVRLGVVKELPRERTQEGVTAQVAPQETTPVEVRRFSDEAREALTKEGYVIYALNGQSIRAQREAGKKFWSTWHEDRRYADFETQSSMSSEVAIKPDALFIPKSNSKKLSEQQDMIAKFSTDLGKKVKGVEAVMGDAADYVGLAFAHLDATGERLFGEKDDYNYARTKTPVEGGVAHVGDFDADHGLHVDHWYPDRGSGRIFAAPLVVPKA